MDSSTQFKHVVDVAWRRKWWVAVPAVLATAASLGLVQTTPKEYRATTTILVARAGVPENVVRSSVTLHIEERMRTLSCKSSAAPTSSRSLDSSRWSPPMPARPGSTRPAGSSARRSFRARPTGTTPGSGFRRRRRSEAGAGITNQLADLFIEQNTRTRASQTTGTARGHRDLGTELPPELEKRDDEISTFKTQNLYELPDQQPANEQLLYSARNNVASLTTAIQAANDRLVELRSQQAAQRATAGVSGGTEAVAGGESSLSWNWRQRFAP